MLLDAEPRRHGGKRREDSKRQGERGGSGEEGGGAFGPGHGRFGSSAVEESLVSCWKAGVTRSYRVTERKQFIRSDRIEGMLLLAALVALHLPAVSPTAPNRQPQMAAAGGTVALVFGSGEGIWLARSTDNGRSFGVPGKV